MLIDRSSYDDQRIQHCIIERRSCSSHAEAVRYSPIISRNDIEPVGKTSELAIRGFKRTSRTGEVEQLKSRRNVEADRAHGLIVGKFDLPDI